MIYLELFLSFFEVGAVSFGGGYAMISLIRDICLSNSWLTESELMNMIAVSESTPGPIAVNMATFVGSKLGGVLGSLVATLGVVLPSFIIILIISALIKNLMKYKPVRAVISGIRPAVVAMIIATSLSLFMSSIIGYTDIKTLPRFDPIMLIILALVVAFSLIFKKFKGKKPSPILTIIFSALLGMALYSI